MIQIQNPSDTIKNREDHLEVSIYMQYKVDPLDQTWENGQKLVKIGHFVPTWRYYWMIQMQNMSDTITKSSGLFSKTKMCNLKSIRPTKLEKMAKNLFFGSLDHSKLHFCDFWMILYDLVTLQNRGHHLVLSKYAISGRSNRPNFKK